MARLFEWDFRIYEKKGLKLLKPENCVDRLFKFLSLTNEGHCVRNIMKLSDMNLLFPLPNNRRWDLDKEILPVFEKL